MGMFSIPVKFKCKSCESIFEYVDQFIGHKKEKHLKEFQKLKCILFEEKTETFTDGHGDGKQDLVSNEDSSLFGRSFPVHQELVEADSDNAGIADNNAKSEHASSWGHQNLILRTSDNNTAHSYSFNLLNAENIIHHVDSNETDPVADRIKQESELGIETELDADSESQFDCFLDNLSTSPSHEELAETNATPLSSVEIKYRVKNTCLESIPSTTSKNENESNSNLTSNPYVLIRRLTSREIQSDTTASISNLNTINYRARAGKRENPEQPLRKKIKRTETISSSHTGVTKPFSCDICGAAFSRKGILVNHIVTHSDLRPFKCNFANCSSSFKAKRNLDQHEKSHSDVLPYKCTYPGCSKACNYPQNMRKHLRSHTDDRPYKCSIAHCDRTFKHPESVKAHVVACHIEDEEVQKLVLVAKYACDVKGCTRKFYKKQDYEKHYKAHTKEAGSLLKCPHSGCSSDFTRAELMLHMRRVHKGQKQPTSSNPLPPHVILVQSEPSPPTTESSLEINKCC